MVLYRTGKCGYEALVADLFNGSHEHRASIKQVSQASKIGARFYLNSQEKLRIQ